VIRGGSANLLGIEADFNSWRLRIGVKNVKQQKLNEAFYLLNLYPDPGTVVILMGL
jgi:hypothetical protein